MQVNFFYFFFVGCQFACFHGAFNMTTGPAHWELLIHGRLVCVHVLSTSVPARIKNLTNVGINDFKHVHLAIPTK